jgi:hypothetical protein
MTDDPRPTGKNLRPLYLIGAMFTLAILLAGIAWWYQYYLQQRPLEYWGTDVAGLIKSAPNVACWQIEPAENPSRAAIKNGTRESRPNTFQADGRTWTKRSVREISQSPGLSNVRRSLLHVGGFSWDDPPPEGPVVWEYALRFWDGSREAVILIAPQADRVLLLGRTDSVSIRPTSKAHRTFLEEQFPIEAAEDAGG